MSTLPFPTCPQCGQEIGLGILYSLLHKERMAGVSTGTVGITCPGCRAKLALNESRYRIIRFSVFIALLVISILVLRNLHRGWGKSADLFSPLFLGGIFAFTFLLDPVYRRFVQLIRLEPDQTSQVVFPLERQEEQISESELEETKEQQETSEWPEKNILTDAEASQSWRCAVCREENPASFEVCWKCQTERSNKTK